MAIVKFSDNVSKSPRISQRQSNKRKAEFLDEEETSEKLYRDCEKAGCNACLPLCFLSASERCAGNGYTARWYHMSHGEHFCNECFDHFYRSTKEGYSTFISWKDAWIVEGKSDPTLKAFVADQLLPYWVRCTLCKKWRQLPKNSQIAPDFIRKFHCKSIGHKKSDPCNVPEDLRASEVSDPVWVDYISQAPLLKFSPAASHLHQFYPEAIGLSPTSCKVSLVSKGNTFVEPFSQTLSGKSPLYMNPDSIEIDEMRELPESTRFQATYLGLRNLVLAVWNSYPQEWLTVESASAHIICRGLVRIFLIHEVEKILTFLSKRGIVNYGLVQSPQGYSLIPENSEKNHVIVIGAGIAGLSSAKHLQNLGVKVTVLEAKSRICGRVFDENEHKSLPGKGAHILTGIASNPFTILCDQAKLPLKILRENLYLLNGYGKTIEKDISKRIHFHFNALLDAAREWGIKHQERDISVFDKLVELHEAFKTDTGIEFTQEEENVFYLYANFIGNSIGVPLKQASVLSWDQSIVLSQISGPDALIPGGYTALLAKLAEDVNIQLDCEVKSVTYDKSDVEVDTTKGVFKATKVLLTVPLPILRNGVIDFCPPLSETKISAYQQLGDCFIEKVIMQFPHKFWKSVTKEADVFGFVPSVTDTRGLSCLFYDVTSATAENIPTLMTYISSSQGVLEDEEDTDIIEKCFCSLSDMFSGMVKEVPSPDKWFVTHWCDDCHTQSSGSFLKVGSKSSLYDDIASAIDSKLYFAGEAAYKQMPHSAAGAYFSGLREAANIVDNLLMN